MGTAISLILAIAKAVPIINLWIEQLSSAYMVSRMASLKKENLEALRKALNEHDQRDLEKAIGNPHSGEASGDAGSVIINQPPPGVSQ